MISHVVIEDIDSDFNNKLFNVWRQERLFWCSDVVMLHKVSWCAKFQVISKIYLIFEKCVNLFTSHVKHLNITFLIIIYEFIQITSP